MYGGVCVCMYVGAGRGGRDYLLSEFRSKFECPTHSSTNSVLEDPEHFLTFHSDPPLLNLRHSLDYIHPV